MAGCCRYHSAMLREELWFAIVSMPLELLVLKDQKDPLKLGTLFLVTMNPSYGI